MAEHGSRDSLLREGRRKLHSVGVRSGLRSRHDVLERAGFAESMDGSMDDMMLT